MTERTYVDEQIEEWSAANVLTIDQFTKAMSDLQKGDPEEDHGNADDLMCQQLCALGYVDAVRVFMEMHKWYA